MSAPTGNTRTHPLHYLKCALDTTHKVTSGELLAHYLHVHLASDTALTAPVEYLTPKKHVGTEEEHWYTRDAVRCPICDSHGVATVFGCLYQVDEPDAGPAWSLERHLREFHNAN